MNCQETTKILFAYTDHEVTPSERKMVEAHLAECVICQRELSALSAMQDRVRQSLHQQVADAAPSPEAWNRLQATLARETQSARLAGLARPLHSVLLSIQSVFAGGTLMRRLALSSLVALALVFSVVTVVPSVRAQVREMIDTWFHFQFPGGRSGVGVGWSGDRGFQPYMPTWLPDGLDLGLNGATTEPGAEYFEFEFHPMPRREGDDRFIRLIEGKGEAVPGLPEGREVTVNGQPAVFTSELSSRHEIQSDPPTPTGARVLAWYTGEVKIELVSNLPESEMIAIAESLVPMEEGQGEWNR